MPVLYGFHNLQDVNAARIADGNVDAVNDAITLAVTTYNAEMNQMLDLFTTRTTSYKERYRQISDATLQPLDENGRALPIKPSGFYDVGYPIMMAGSAWGETYLARAKMTVGDAEAATAQMLRADRNWMRRQMLTALFANVTWTFGDPAYGDITVQPLAQAGDGVTYGTTTGTSATDTHQLAYANAIGAGADNPFPAIYAELKEHPQNTGEVVALIPTALKATTQALTTFNPVADPNITSGNASDRLTGNLGVSVPGTIFGYEDSGVWLVEWAQLPATHIVAFTTGGDRPLGMREHPEPELQGFKQVAEYNKHPFFERQWLRMAGFGARNRVGAVVVRVGNGTYDEPSGYTPPV